MGTPNLVLRSQMQEATPKVHAALSWLVPAMEDAAKKRGRKSFFGKDLGAEAEGKVLGHLAVAIRALYEDQLAGADSTSADLYARFFDSLSFFAQAYPNWPAAYQYAIDLLASGAPSPAAAGVIDGERLRYAEWRRYLDQPTLLRKKES